MLKINCLANTEETTVNAMFTAVTFEKFNMEIELTESAIEVQKKVLASNEKTSAEKQVATEKIAVLEKDLAEFRAELEKVQSVHDSVVSEIASASKTFENGETITNDYDAVRNVLRLIACGENTRFFSICNLKKIDMMEELYNAFSAIHDIERANNDGYVVNEVNSYKDCNKLVNKVVFSTFSIPVENAYTKAVKIRFNGTDLAMMHESFHNGITVSCKKDAKTGEIKHEKTELSSCIKCIQNKKTGETKYEGDKFMTNLAKVAFGYLYK
jgi:hypothetical protein